MCHIYVQQHHLGMARVVLHLRASSPAAKCQISFAHRSRLLPLLIQHGSQQPALANLVIAELPAANHCTLQLLLETFHRLSGNAAVNEMDAHTVATVMTPCIAWNPPPKPKVSSCSFLAQCSWKLQYRAPVCLSPHTTHISCTTHLLACMISVH